jgi:hypothetical protein
MHRDDRAADYIDCRRHRRPHEVFPVRVQAYAFGPGVTHRDLLVSPDHALFLDGVLIPARYLCNGTTIRQEAVAAVSYFHIELEQHDVLLAEGLPAESYLDTGNRDAFADGGITSDDEGAAPAMAHAELPARLGSKRFARHWCWPANS